MSVSTIECIVENGKITLPADVHVPDRAKVYVVIPDVPLKPSPVRIVSPRLADPADAARFKLTVEEVRK